MLKPVKEYNTPDTYINTYPKVTAFGTCMGTSELRKDTEGFYELDNETGKTYRVDEETARTFLRMHDHWGYERAFGEPVPED